MSDTQKTLLNQDITVAIEPWQQRREPFLELCRELARQRDKFTGGNDVDSDLSVATRSVAAVSKFLLAAVPTAPQLAEVLDMLGKSLTDLDRGLIPPLLKRKPKPHGQHKPLELEQTWAIAAAIVTVLNKQFGVNLGEAARLVEHEFESRNRPLPGRSGRSAAQSGRSGVRLRNWRNRLLERPHTDAARHAYNDVIGAASRLTGSDLNVSEVLLSVLRDKLAAPPVASEIAF